MIKETLYLSALATIGLLLSACDKGSETEEKDTVGPEISVYEPDPNDTYAVGDTIYLLADFVDDSEIQEINVNLIIGTDTTLIWPIPDVLFGNIKNYHLDAFVMDTYNVNADAIMRFEAIDKKENATVTEVPISLTL